MILKKLLTYKVTKIRIVDNLKKPIDLSTKRADIKVDMWINLIISVDMYRNQGGGYPQKRTILSTTVHIFEFSCG